MTNFYRDYHAVGMKVFGIYGATDGVCDCDNPGCQSAFKHPRISNWQKIPLWSDEQLESMNEAGFFDTGFGAIVDGYLVIDVDARNGGLDSLERLKNDYPDIERDCGFIVSTGSGGGSRHLYYKLTETQALLHKHNDYPGIDFKSSGFVIGAGSSHLSGNDYEAVIGMPQDITEAPQDLVLALKKPDIYRANYDSKWIDFSDEELGNILEYIPNHEEDYDKWIQVGMAIHHTTGGEGYRLWVDWSSQAKKHNERDMDTKWHSFGKSSSNVTIGTLIYHARQNGYVMPIQSEEVSLEIDNDHSEVDLLRPPGFVGELAEWINSQCLYSRESLAVATALQIVSNSAGMRYYDELNGITPNLMCFCVAGSGTGKESVLKAYAESMKAAGLSAALYGSFKSEQELYRNLLRHQGAYYAIDELGIHLSKIKNAAKKGGATYLEGLLGAVMSTFTKADSYLPITGDLKEEMRVAISKEIASTNKQLEDGETTFLLKKLDSLERQQKSIEQGIENPFLSILGFTTPSTFDALFDYEQATNGFLSRALLFRELETNPRRKEKFRKLKMNERMRSKLQNLFSPGAFDAEEFAHRIEYTADKQPIPTTEEAEILLDESYNYFWQLAEEHKETSGLEAIPRRGYEMVAKISMVLSIPEGVRTGEHVKWAAALAKKDMMSKLALAQSNTTSNITDQAVNKIKTIVGKDWVKAGAVRNQCRKHTKEEIEKALQYLVDNKVLTMKEEQHPVKKSQTVVSYKSNR